jgi:hypothetical protein
MTDDPLAILARPSSPEPASTPEEAILRELAYVRVRLGVVADRQEAIARLLLRSIPLPGDLAEQLWQMVATERPARSG